MDPEKYSIKMFIKFSTSRSGEIKIECKYLPIIQPYAMCEPDDTLYNNIFNISNFRI